MCLAVVICSNSQIGQIILHLILHREHGSNHIMLLDKLQVVRSEFSSIRFLLVVYLVRRHSFGFVSVRGGHPMVHYKPNSNDASYCISFLVSHTLFNPSLKSRLGDVEGLADHEASMGHEDESGRVELEYRALGNDTERNLVVDPALADPVGDQGDDA